MLTSVGYLNSSTLTVLIVVLGICCEQAANKLIKVLSSSYGILLDCTEDTDIEDSKRFLNPSFPKLTARITSPISEVTALSPHGMLWSLA